VRTTRPFPKKVQIFKAGKAWHQQERRSELILAMETDTRYKSSLRMGQTGSAALVKKLPPVNIYDKKNHNI
jgi:hypothetical protein